MTELSIGLGTTAVLLQCLRQEVSTGHPHFISVFYPVGLRIVLTTSSDFAVHTNHARTLGDDYCHGLNWEISKKDNVAPRLPLLIVALRERKM